MTIHNTEDRPYQFTPPEDRGKCDRMWTTDIEILAMRVEQLSKVEWNLDNFKPEAYSREDRQHNEINQIELVIKVAKLRAEVVYTQAKLDYYAAYMAANSRLGFRDDPTA